MRALAAILAASLLCGCSMVRLAYENADSYLRWRAGNYLDVHGEAVDELDAAIADFHDWHRAQALPQYARLADEARQALRAAVARQDPELRLRLSELRRLRGEADVAVVSAASAIAGAVFRPSGSSTKFSCSSASSRPSAHRMPLRCTRSGSKYACPA